MISHGSTDNTLRHKASCGTSQGTLNLKPLPKALGHNGPYIGGLIDPVERDCQRIPDHTLLFRNLETFEPDLCEAISLVWVGMKDLMLAKDRLASGDDEPEAVLTMATEQLSVAFKLMQEAYLIAEVLNDREWRRIEAQATKDFLATVPNTPPSAMGALARLQEEATLTWRISVLLDRMSAARGVQQQWPTSDTEKLKSLIDRLEIAARIPTAAELDGLNDDDLAHELRELEAGIGRARKTITLIHAIRTVRHA